MTALFYFALLLGFSKVHIGGAFGHDYKITLTDTRFEPTEESGAYTSDKDLDGEFFTLKREILVRPTLTLKEMQRVLTHEIFVHGCYLESKMHDGKLRDEDGVANNIDECLADTIRANPELIKFLAINPNLE
jgi:hypothetical protein